MMLDEIDKLGRDFRGESGGSALLETLDPEQNCGLPRQLPLDVPFDLSKTLSSARPTCCTRFLRLCWTGMELIFLQGYSEDEKMHIASRYLIPRQIKRTHHAREIEFPEEAVRYIVRHYTREAGAGGSWSRRWARSAASRRGVG